MSEVKLRYVLTQTEVQHDASAIKSYVDTGRRLIKELVEQDRSDASIDQQFSVWRQVREEVRRQKIKDRLDRNIAM